MPIKLGNNAQAHLAAPLAADGDTIVLLTTEVGNFPALSAGEWFPLTLADSAGHIEVARVTARSGNILTALRGQEGTTARAWLTGDRAELRLTAGALNQMQVDARSYADGLNTAVRTDLTAGVADAKTYADTKDGVVRSDLNASITALTGTVGTKFDKAGGTITGDVTIYRAATPGTGVVFFGNSGSRYLYYDGTNYTMPGANLVVNGGTVWHSGNLNPGAYLPLGGGTMTGNLTLSNTAMYITHYDTDWGANRHIHSNGGSIGFLTSGGGWAAYSDNAGNWIATANVGAYSDRRHKKHIKTIKDGLDLVERLRGVRYTRKRDGAKCVGVIAQEVQDVVPEVVGETKEGLFVDYGNLAAPLIEAVKELSARVKALETREVAP